jgi:hypothetical protein
MRPIVLKDAQILTFVDLPWSGGIEKNNSAPANKASRTGPGE